mgnify:CR=1 FL=1
MTDKVTADTILKYYEDKVAAKEATFDTKFHLETAFKLAVSLGDEQDLLAEMKQTVAQMKYNILNDQAKRNVAAADAEIETKDEYKNMRKQEAKIDRINEIIRIAKKMGDNSY